MIELQLRDREMLRVCFEQQFLLMEHVNEFFPENPSGCEARRRVCELVEAGLLRRQFTPILGRKVLLRVTKAGRSIAEKSGAAPVHLSNRVAPSTLIHDALVTSVRLRLSRVWEARFVCERAIKESDYPTVPDGVFMFPSGVGIAIEVENSDKGRSRFLRLAERWKEVRSIFAVLYVATDERLERSIQKYLSKASDAKPLALVSWPKLKAGTPRPWTVRGEVPLLERRVF